MIKMGRLLILTLIIITSISGLTTAIQEYTNSPQLSEKLYTPDLSKVKLTKIGSGVVSTKQFNGELVLEKTQYCDGNGAYFNLPTEYDRSKGVIVIEADIYNYEQWSGCNEVSVILGNSKNQGYAVGYSAFDGHDMWVSYKPDASGTDIHLDSISIVNTLGNRWVHTKLIIYPSGYIKGVLYDYQTGNSWSVIVKDNRITKFNRILILDGNDYRVKNIKVYYDYSEGYCPDSCSIVTPDYYIQIPNDADFGSAYDSKYGWGDYVRVATLNDGQPAIYKHTEPDPRGGAYVLPVTLDRTKYNIVIEADVMKPSTVNYNGLRFGLEDSNWNGYTTYIATYNPFKLGYEQRHAGLYSSIKYNTLSVGYSAGEWIHVRMILYSDGRVYVSITKNGVVYAKTWTDSTYNQFDRVVIRGGYPFYYRNFKVYALSSDPLSVILSNDLNCDFYIVSKFAKLLNIEVRYLI